MIGRHSLSKEAFLDLATGRGTADAIQVLKSIEVSKHLLLLRGVLNDAPAELVEAYTLLSNASKVDPEGVRHLIAGPLIGAWAVNCLRGSPSSARREYLGAVALAAAVRAEVDGSATVVARGGRVHFPSLGTAAIHGEGPVRVTAGAVPQRIRLATHRIRVEHSGLDFDVEIDDLDPFRDGQRLGASPRLAEHELALWRARLQEAWELLVTRHRRRAETIRLGLRVIVPLREPPDGTEISATSRHSFGAVSLSMPRAARNLALALVHEFQHTKLGALLDLMPLYRPDGRRYYSPWRSDARPINGLLQGAYAFLAVADFWRHEDEFRCARAADQTLMACGRMREAGSLTAAGERFVEAMRDSAASVIGGLSHSVVWRARAANRDHLSRWLSRPV